MFSRAPWSAFCSPRKCPWLQLLSACLGLSALCLWLRRLLETQLPRRMSRSHANLSIAPSVQHLVSHFFTPSSLPFLLCPDDSSQHHLAPILYHPGRLGVILNSPFPSHPMHSQPRSPLDLMFPIFSTTPLVQAITFVCLASCHSHLFLPRTWPSL